MWFVGKGANLEPFGAYEGGFLVLAKGDRYRNLGALGQRADTRFLRACASGQIQAPLPLGKGKDSRPFGAQEGRRNPTCNPSNFFKNKYMQPFNF